MQGAQIWQRALSELQGIMAQVNYTTWLQQTRCVGLEGTTLTVSVPSAYHGEYLEKRIPTLISKTMKEIGCGHLQLRYIVVPDESGQANGRGKAQPRNGISNGNGGANANGGGASYSNGSVEPAFFGTGSSMLNPRYVFDTFIVGGGNRFAHAASVSVAENPARRYNPLFIWGGVGLGKTHLLHAIGHEAMRHNAQLRVLYTSSEKFTNEMIGAIQKGKTEHFRSRYREVDILLIDDIQFIAGKESTQEEFFHTFNSLYEAQKQLVMTSDRHPKAMNTLEERLRSRFEWGLLADVQAPDLEHRIAILQAKAVLQPVPVPKNVIDYIARQVQSNIRELEGTLTRITAMASLQNSAVTLELATSALATLQGGTRRSQPTLDEVMEAVLNFYKVDRTTMLSPARDRAIALPRQVAMFLMREDTGCSLPRIGTYLGNRDHSTVMHGCDKISEELKNENAQIRREVMAIRSALYETHER